MPAGACKNNNAVQTIAKSVCQNANAEPRKSSFFRHFRFVKIFYSFRKGICLRRYMN